MPCPTLQATLEGLFDFFHHQESFCGLSQDVARGRQELDDVFMMGKTPEHGIFKEEVDHGGSGQGAVHR